MVEIVSQIKTAESQADEIRRGARNQVKQLVDEAATAGKNHLEAESQKAASQAADIVGKAEEEAAAYLSQQAQYSQAQSKEISGGAAANMQKAAAFIVERIVNSL